MGKKTSGVILSTLEQKQINSIQNLIHSSLKRHDEKITLKDDEIGITDASDSLGGFADLMQESFIKKSNEKEEMEKRFGQPLL